MLQPHITGRLDHWARKLHHAERQRSRAWIGDRQRSKWHTARTRWMNAGAPVVVHDSVIVFVPPDCTAYQRRNKRGGGL